MEVRIGVLLPHSDMFPTLSIDFLNGTKLPFKLSGSQKHTAKFIIESIGNATDTSLLQRIEQMMLQDETDVIVCFCGYFMIENLVKLANAYKKPIIHVSLGARVLKPIHQSPYVVYQSLNLCHTSYLSGKYAVENFGKKVAMLTSFYDGGYHIAEAFFNGVTDSGGEMVYNYVSPMDYKLETFQTMTEGIEESNADVIFAIFSFKEGNKILEKLVASGMDKLPIIAIPLMTDETILDVESVPKNMLSIASWAFGDSLPEMNQFCENYQNQYEEAPTIFGLLGQEIGDVIFNCVEKEGKIPNKIADYLKEQTMVTPRGKVRYNAFNESLPENFKIRKLEKIQDHYQNNVIGSMDDAAAEVIYEKMENLPHSGWKNPYICT